MDKLYLGEPLVSLYSFHIISVINWHSAGTTHFSDFPYLYGNLLLYVTSTLSMVN